MDNLGYIVAIIVIVLVLNFYIVYKRVRQEGSGRRSRGRKYRAPYESEQAIWRDSEVARRIERENEDAMERVKLKNETLAMFETVRQRHAKKETLERLGLDAVDNLDDLKSIGLDDYLNDKGEVKADEG